MLQFLIDLLDFSQTVWSSRDRKSFHYYFDSAALTTSSRFSFYLANVFVKLFWIVAMDLLWIVCRLPLKPVIYRSTAHPVGPLIEQYFSYHLYCVVSMMRSVSLGKPWSVDRLLIGTTKRRPFHRVDLCNLTWTLPLYCSRAGELANWLLSWILLSACEPLQCKVVKGCRP